MNIAAFRTPGQPARIYELGKPKKLNFSIPERGFVMAPFDPMEEARLYPLKREVESIPQEILKANHRDYKFREFTKTEHAEYIKEIKKRLNGNPEHKIVAARNKRIALSKTEAGEIFESLCEEYPEAFVFLISCQEYGTWAGASPELLLRREGERIVTMALAGTRKAGTPGEWDTKNIQEQEIVIKHIYNVFEDHKIEYTHERPRTLKAGGIEHIMTPIEGMIKVSETEIGPLLKDLSPTPALSGYPRGTALAVIKRFEGDRLLYGGYCGPIEENGDFRFNVILRCGYIEPGGEAVLVSGGGITYMSNPETEWEETEKKMRTLEGKIAKKCDSR